METLELSLLDAKNWLQGEIGSISVSVNAATRKTLEETRSSLESLGDACRLLSDNSRREIEKRNMKVYKRARALNKIARLFLRRVGQVKIPDEVSYDSMSLLVKETQKTLMAIETDALKWFPRISPFFIIDRRRFLATLEKAKKSAAGLQEFFEKEYVKVKKIEEAFRAISELQDIERELANLSRNRAKAENKKEAIAGEISEAQRIIANLRDSAALAELDSVNNETKRLKTELRRSLRHLRKPLIKFRVFTRRGGGSNLTPEEKQLLDQYVEKPFETFASEENGYPILKKILRKLGHSMSVGNLKLKTDRKKKARQTIVRLTKEKSLAVLHEKCRNIRDRSLEVATSAELTEARRRLSSLQENQENLVTKKERAELRETTLEDTFSSTLQKTREIRDRVENGMTDITGRRIRIKQRAQLF